MQAIGKGLQLSEVFTSIEGEGIFLGTKTLFIRMAGCHLKCYWCDTAYALPMDSGVTYSIDDAKKLISNSLQPNTFKVNFTGGEPLIQYEAVTELAKFVKDDKGLRTYLESACYDARRFAKVLPYIDICKVEFKMSDSKVVDINSYIDLLHNELECLKLAINDKKLTYIKVVVTNSTRKKEFKSLLTLIFENLKSSNDISGLIIQPVYGFGQISLEHLLNFYDLAYSFYRDVRIIPQLHKLIGAR
jgi:organic radical activating enzyme